MKDIQWKHAWLIARSLQQPWGSLPWETVQASLKDSNPLPTLREHCHHAGLQDPRLPGRIIIGGEPFLESREGQMHWRVNSTGQATLWVVHENTELSVTTELPSIRVLMDSGTYDAADVHLLQMALSPLCGLHETLTFTAPLMQKAHKRKN